MEKFAGLKSHPLPAFDAAPDQCSLILEDRKSYFRYQRRDASTVINSPNYIRSWNCIVNFAIGYSMLGETMEKTRRDKSKGRMQILSTKQIILRFEMELIISVIRNTDNFLKYLRIHWIFVSWTTVYRIFVVLTLFTFPFLFIYRIMASYIRKKRTNKKTKYIASSLLMFSI